MAQCSHYVKTKESQGFFIGNLKRCEKKAVGKLVCPDGRDCPGAYKCQEHADAVIKEYQEKLHETWTLRPLKEYEKV